MTNSLIQTWNQCCIKRTRKKVTNKPWNTGTSYTYFINHVANFLLGGAPGEAGEGTRGGSPAFIWTLIAL